MNARFPKTVEQTYLRIFKGALIALLSLALIGSAALIFKAAAERSTAPVAIDPPKPPPKPTVDATAFVTEITGSDRSEEPDPMTSASQPKENLEETRRERVMHQIDDLFGYYKTYQTNCGIGSDLRASREDFGAMFNVDSMMKLFDEYGEEFANSQSYFAKAVLSNTAIIELCRKKNPRPQVFWPSLNWHLKAWRDSVEKSASFTSIEAQRFADESAREQARVEQKHSDARRSLTNAFIAFGIFMAFMTILIFYRIQEGFQLIATAIRDRK